MSAEVKIVTRDDKQEDLSRIPVSILNKLDKLGEFAQAMVNDLGLMYRQIHEVAEITQQDNLGLAALIDMLKEKNYFDQ